MDRAGGCVQITSARESTVKYCRAFSVSEGLESCYAINFTSLVALSTQQFISCDTEGCYGCAGGTLQGAVDWLMKV